VPRPPDVFAEKGALRALQRRRLEELDPEERRVRSGNLLARLGELPAWQAARRVLLFAPLPAEPDLDLLWTADGLSGKECAYPRVDGERMHLVRVRGLADLQPGRWGLREPALGDGSSEVALKDLDVLLVPGLAFDLNGGRLGRGGGFYDRLLADKGAATLAIGVAFAFQIVPKLPMAPHDVIMDAVVTD
jgi:5-formyltetrahydrofolate cyclo-ligase